MFTSIKVECPVKENDHTWSWQLVSIDVNSIGEFHPSKFSIKIYSEKGVFKENVNYLFVTFLFSLSWILGSQTLSRNSWCTLSLKRLCKIEYLAVIILLQRNNRFYIWLLQHLHFVLIHDGLTPKVRPQAVIVVLEKGVQKPRHIVCRLHLNDNKSFFASTQSLSLRFFITWHLMYLVCLAFNNHHQNVHHDHVRA